MSKRKRPCVTVKEEPMVTSALTLHHHYCDPTLDVELVSADKVILKAGSWALNKECTLFKDLLSGKTPTNSAPFRVNLPSNAQTISQFMDLLGLTPHNRQLPINAETLPLFRLVYHVQCDSILTLLKRHMVQHGSSATLFAAARLTNDDEQLLRGAVKRISGYSNGGYYLERQLSCIEPLYFYHLARQCFEREPDWMTSAAKFASWMWVENPKRVDAFVKSVQTGKFCQYPVDKWVPEQDSNAS